MTEEKKLWSIRPGDPTKIGTCRTADGYNFCVHAVGEQPVDLLFYKKGEEQPEQVIRIPESCRTGNRFAVVVQKHNLSIYEYEYRQGDRVLMDMGARAVCGTGCFGQKPEEYAAQKSRVMKTSMVLPLAEPVPYEEMILYKVHVRGYTMQKNSRVRRKGTFQGLCEKISYWKQLGVTSIELMPAYDFEEFPLQEKKSRYLTVENEDAKLNYWGYTKGRYFAPKPSYCAGKYPELEVKEFITKLHEEGMECLMDFCFPSEIEPALAVEILQFWKMEYQIDGFFLMGEGAWLELIARDDVLADCKLICPGYDMNRLYRMQHSKKRRLGECNPGFQNTMRRFLKGDEGQVQDVLTFSKKNAVSHGNIQYMANHDGFTLADLVSYDYRHNEANGENNQDGSSCNFSWNCGAEGETRKTAILELRKQQMRNAMMLLMLSQGTPLIYGGDEMGNSQNGNNNAYCQDNEIGWIDWSKARKYADFTTFIQNLIAFRKEHPILHMPYELRATDYKSLGWPEISYHSAKAWFVDRESTCRQAGIMYCGSYAKKTDETTDDFIYVLYNMYWSEREIALPDLPEGKKWYLAADSGKKSEEAISRPGEETKVTGKKSLKVLGRTILILIGK